MMKTLHIFGNEEERICRTVSFTTARTGEQSPVVYLKLIDIFLSHFYGHNLWDLNSEAAEGLWRTWNTMVRDIHQLPFATHRFILEDLCSAKHLKLRLFSRFTKFKQKLQESNNNLPTNLLAVQIRDLRSTVARNCRCRY